MSKVVYCAPTLPVMPASPAKAVEAKAIGRLTSGRGALHVPERELPLSMCPLPVCCCAHARSSTVTVAFLPSNFPLSGALFHLGFRVGQVAAFRVPPCHGVGRRRTGPQHSRWQCSSWMATSLIKSCVHARLVASPTCFPQEPTATNSCVSVRLASVPMSVGRS